MRSYLPARSPAKPRPKLLDQVRETIRRKHYSMRTEAAYIDWIKRYILFHQKRHPAEMGAREIEQFLNYLAVSEGGGRLDPEPGPECVSVPLPRSTPSGV